MAQQKYVTCEEPPYYTVEATLCADDLDPCRCSQTFSWDASAGAEYYEVRRYILMDFGGTDLRWALEGIVGSPNTPEWSFTEDTPVGEPGQVYLYTVRACNSAECSGWSNIETNSVKQTALSVTCFPTRFGNPACMELEGWQ